MPVQLPITKLWNFTYWTHFNYELMIFQPVSNFLDSAQKLFWRQFKVHVRETYDFVFLSTIFHDPRFPTREKNIYEKPLIQQHRPEIY